MLIRIIDTLPRLPAHDNNMRLIESEGMSKIMAHHLHDASHCIDLFQSGCATVPRTVRRVYEI